MNIILFEGSSILYSNFFFIVWYLIHHFITNTMECIPVLRSYDVADTEETSFKQQV